MFCRVSTCPSCETCLDTPSLWLVCGPMAHPSFTSEYLRHATQPLKAVKAMLPRPTLFQSQQPRKWVPNLTPGKPNTNWKAATGLAKKHQERLHTHICQLDWAWQHETRAFGHEWLDDLETLGVGWMLCHVLSTSKSMKERLSVFSWLVDSWLW